MPGTIELPGEDSRAAARWELRWAEDRLSDIAYDGAKDQWLTGFAAAEQAVAAAAQILKLISGDMPHRRAIHPNCSPIRAGLHRFEPAVRGLAHIVGGGRFTTTGTVPGTTARRLLGWPVGHHWCLPRRRQRRSTPRTPDRTYIVGSRSTTARSAS